MIVRSTGFSLTELLVVVAIIGVLSAAGIVTYTFYTDGVKQDLKQNELRDLASAIFKDVNAVNMNLSGLSDASVQLQRSGLCLDHAIAAVRGANTLYKNDLNAANATAIYGPSLGNNPPRLGEMMIYCSNPEKPISQTNLLRFCVCYDEPCSFSEEENCPKTWQ